MTLRGKAHDFMKISPAGKGYLPDVAQRNGVRNLILEAVSGGLQYPIMKTLLRTNKLVLPLAGVLGFAVIFVLTQCAVFTSGNGKVAIADQMITMQPAVDLSPADASAMDAILKKHSKDLYLVDTVDNGKIVNTKGSLREEVLTAAVKTAIANESQRGHHQVVGQVVCAPPCILQFVHRSHSDRTAEKQRLVAELKPILAKYQ